MTKTILTLSGRDLDEDTANSLREKFYNFMKDPGADVMVLGAINADVTFTLTQVEVPLVPKTEEPADPTLATQVAPLDPSLVDKTAAVD